MADLDTVGPAPRARRRHAQASPEDMAPDWGAALRGQALLRVGLGGVLILGGLVGVRLLHMRLPYASLMGVCYLAYAAGLQALTSGAGLVASRRMAYVTAVVDSVMLTAWMLVSGSVGQLIVPVYLFTAIGYGMRTGSRRIMQVSQASAVLGLLLAPLVPYWREHTMFWLSALVSVVLVPSYVGVLMQKVHRALRHAEAESRAKSGLLARVGRELRTPLSGISNAAELIQVEAQEARPRQLARTILSLSNHLLADLRAMLEQGTATLGKLELASEPLHLARLLQVVGAAVEIRARNKALDFSVHVDPRIRDAVLGDPNWLSRVLINLLGNAVKFTESGSVSLDVCLLRERTDAYLVRFAVHDTGVGIAKEHQQRIFDPFVQVGEPATSQADGAGLGLAICRQVVERMGGTLRLRSEPGVGSSFSFDLPLRRVSAQAAPVDDPDSLVWLGEEPPRRLLVVDDHPTNRVLLQQLLQREGHEVVVATSGEHALRILADDPHFDLLLIDCDAGGVDAALLLRTHRAAARRSVPAYLLSADADAPGASTMRESGALGVLTKPVRLRALRDAIRTACSGEKPLPQAGGPGLAPTPRQAAAAAAARLRPVPVVYIDMAVIDRLRGIGTSPGFVQELLERAVADIEDGTRLLLQSLQGGDLEAARDAAHALKGVCMETGAMRLMNLALAVMRTDGSYLLESRSRIASELRETSQRTAEALAAIAADATRQVAGF